MLLFPDPTIRSVGLDLSDRAIRLVEIRRGPFYRRKLQLHRYAEELLPEGLAVRGEFKKPEEVVTHLKNLIKKAYGRQVTRSAVVSLPETRTFIKVITVKRPEKVEDLEKAAMIEAELHIPAPMADLYVDWQTFDDVASIAPGKPVTVTIGAAPRAIVDGYLQAFEAAGIVPVAFEIEAQAIVRSVIRTSKENADIPTGIIDFGATRSSFIVYDHGTIQFTVSLPLSGADLTRQIAEALQVPVEEAERTKRQCGVDEKACGPELRKISQSFMREMADRILDSMSFYRDHFAGGRPLARVIVSGGGANTRGVDTVLSELTGTAVVLADPWVNIDPQHCPLPREIIVSNATAIGLALRHVFENDERRRIHAPKALVRRLKKHEGPSL